MLSLIDGKLGAWAKTLEFDDYTHVWEKCSSRSDQSGMVEAKRAHQRWNSTKARLSLRGALHEAPAVPDGLRFKRIVAHDPVRPPRQPNAPGSASTVLQPQNRASAWRRCRSSEPEGQGFDDGNLRLLAIRSRARKLHPLSQDEAHLVTSRQFRAATTETDPDRGAEDASRAWKRRWCRTGGPSGHRAGPSPSCRVRTEHSPVRRSDPR